MPKRIVIVGASLAGLRAAESLRQVGHDGPIVLVGDEAHRPYDRPPLSKQLLTGKAEVADTALRHIEDLDVEWMLDTTASALDLDRRRIATVGGGDIGFDELVIATGAHPRRLEGAPAGPGVHYLRTLDEALALKSDMATASKLAIVGAGFIGLEVASSAQQLGLEVTVLEALPVPLERSIGPQMGEFMAGWHRRKGIDIRLGVGFAGLEGGDRPEAVRLVDGSTVAADLVLIGIGAAPTTGWLQGCGVDLDDGVVCDDRLRVLSGGRPVPGVVAAGDVCRWHHRGYGKTVRLEHWTNATEQGEAVARTLTEGDAAEPFEPVPYFWSDQHGVKLQFVGRAEPGDETQVIDGALEEDRFVVAYHRSGQLVGALGMRRPARIMAMASSIATKAPFPPE